MGGEGGANEGYTSKGDKPVSACSNVWDDGV